MKYVKSGPFTSDQLSINETINEISDIVAIIKNTIKNISTHESDFITKNLNEIETYIPLIKHKVDTALKFVPQQIQEKEYL